MKTFFAVQFTTDADGVALSYIVVPYQHFLRDIKNKGYKTSLNGHKTAFEAEQAANAIVGLNLADTLTANAAVITDSQEAEAAEVNEGQPDAHGH